jgi:hypothetical protein
MCYWLLHACADDQKPNRNWLRRDDMKTHMCCSSARQSHAFDEGNVAWRVISKQTLLRVLLSVLDTRRHFSDDEGIVAWRVILTENVIQGG